MRWFANEEVRSSARPPRNMRKSNQLTCIHDLRLQQLPARPDNFLDAFYLSRDETRAVQPTA